MLIGLYKTPDHPFVLHNFKGFRSVNFFRRTMHSKSPLVNLAERHETLLANKWVSVCNSQLLLISKKDLPIHLLIIYCFISLQIFSKCKWFYHFIITKVIFRYFFSVGIGNELLRVCYNFNYLYSVWNWFKHLYGVKCSL